MADTPAPAAGKEMTIPGLGKVSKKTATIAGLVAVGVLGYAYYRHARMTASAASTAAAGGTTADTSNVDPQTGFPYGSAEDTAALAQLDGSGGLGLGSGLGLGDGGIDPSTGLPLGSVQDQQALQDLGLGGGGVVTAPAPAPSVTNSAWEQTAISDMEAGGVSQATIASAEAGLPRYLAKLPLTPDQAVAVQMAVGLAGPPPEGGPFSIVKAPVAPKPPKPKQPTKTVEADGHQDLQAIAVANHDTEAEVIKWNPVLARKFAGTGHALPKGTKVRV